MHREILALGSSDAREVDHLNHDTLDNQRANLRAVGHEENQQNQKAPKGYSYHRHTGKYLARLRANKKYIYLGIFETPEEARRAYLEANRIYHPSAPINQEVLP